MAKAARKIFLDANVVIQAGKPPGGPIIERLVDLVNAGVIQVLTTDLTITEVSKKHIENELNHVKDVSRPHIRRLIEEHLEVVLPEDSKSKLKDSITKKYKNSVAKMFEKLEAKKLPIDAVKPSVVFDAYSTKSGFFSGEGKKDQFPDAFVFECLKAEASADTPVTIISSDGDFKAPVKGFDHIDVVESITEFLKGLGLEDAPEAVKFIERNNDELNRIALNELQDWGLIVTDVEDAEVEVDSIKSIVIGDPISFKSVEEGEDMLVIAEAKITANVSYAHPDWDNAIWDSEDKILIPFDTSEGETEIEVTGKLAISVTVGEDGKPESISEIKFRGTDFLYVELFPYDPYK